MGDVGEIKAKVTISYDGSGVGKAKEDLASLSDIVGSELAGNVGSANESLASLDGQMGKSAASTSAFTSSIGALEKPLTVGESAITSVTEALSTHQAAIENIGGAYESLQKPVESTMTLLEEASPPMLEITKNAQSMQTQVEAMGDGFAQIHESLSQSVPLLPTFADSLHAVSEQFDPRAFGLDTFTENMAVFQDALVNPYPFQMIRQYLGETGQTWSDFSSSIGSDNAGFLQQMAENASVSQKTFSSMSSGVQSVGQTFYEAAGSTEVFTKQWNDSLEASSGINGMGGVGTVLYGPAESWTKLDNALASANEGINQFGGVGSTTYGPEGLASIFNKYGGVGSEVYGPETPPMGFGEAFGNTMGGITGFLNDIAMPLMAVQMIGMAVGQVGQGIYDMAAIAEGPAAHSLGSFTGTVDALGQSAQKAATTFSEGFGQGVLPTLNQLNDQISQNNDLGGFGKALGEAGSFLFNVARIGTGLDPIGGIQGLINQGASTFGLPEPFQGPGPQDSIQLAIQRTIEQMPQQLAIATTQMAAEANSPQYLAAQAYLSSGTAQASLGQQYYNASHLSGMSPFDYTPQNYQNAMMHSIAAMTQPSAGISAVDINRAWFNSMSPGDSIPSRSIPSSQTPFEWGDLWGLTTPGAAINMFRGTEGSSLQGVWTGLGNMWNWMSSNGPGGADAMFTNTGRGLVGGIANGWNGFTDWLGGLFGGGASAPPAVAGGCFPAGTLVYMADGTRKAIETLQVGERVLAHDGEKQVIQPITDRITFPAKQTYKLTFDGGKTLTLTDSHPVSTLQGWKSISPASTKAENPDLPVTTLQIGDRIHTLNGTCTLLAIETREIVPVYNITVSGSHTYYADSVLVHNAKLSQSVNFADQTQGMQLPHLDLSGITSSLAGAFSGIQLPHLDLSGITSNLTGAFSGIQLPHLDLSGMTSGLTSAFSGIQLPHIDLSGMMSGLQSAFSGIQMPHIDLSGIMSGLTSAFSGIQLPHLDLSGMMSGLTSAFSGLQLPSLPNIGGMISSQLGNIFTGIQLPSIPNIGGMVTGALGSMFSSIQLPSLPNLGGMISGAISSMFSGIHMPDLPNIGTMLNGAISNMFSGLSIPMFASGVENFSGGTAIVGEGSMPEAIAYNGQYAMVNRPTLVNLPSGASVYPMDSLSNYAFSNPSVLGGGGFSPISLGGGGGGNGPQSVNVMVQLDSQSIISAIGLPLAANVRLTSALRSF
jgi:hypothetical protein